MSYSSGKIDFKHTGRNLLDIIIKDFWDENGKVANEKLIGNDKAFLWPYGGFLEAVSAGYENFPEDESLKCLYIDVLNGIAQYKNLRDDSLLAYAATNGGHGDVYYDDNVWIVIGYLKAYRLLKDKKWLDKSQEVIAFCYSGWDQLLGGGVYWMENNKSSKNACINAPLALASAELYLATKNILFLEWSVKLYNWTKQNLLDRNDLYNDSINLHEKIDATKYSYNTGCMVAAAARLYQITSDQKYLSDATNSSRASYDGGFGVVGIEKYLFNGAMPWFNSWLLEGYRAFYEIDTHTDSFLQGFVLALDYAVLNCANAAGYISADWQTQGGPKDEKVNLLDQSGTVRVLFDIHQWLSKYKNSKEVCLCAID
jgi:hypothetical protein